MTVTVTFTAAEADHVLTLLRDASLEGSYYGNREQYWRRHERIFDRLQDARGMQAPSRKAKMGQSKASGNAE